MGAYDGSGVGDGDGVCGLRSFEKSVRKARGFPSLPGGEAEYASANGSLLSQDVTTTCTLLSSGKVSRRGNTQADLGSEALSYDVTSWPHPLEKCMRGARSCHILVAAGQVAFLSPASRTQEYGRALLDASVGD